MIELIVAFGAGLISFLSPCVLPLIPGYISYISGNSLNELLEKKNTNLTPIILFTVGFSIVFIVFGAASTFLGQVLLKNSYELRVVAGLLIVMLSLHIIGIINLKFLNYEKRIQTNININFFSPILIGMAFASGWTPCIGPILGSILALASTEESINRGIILLSFYSLGLALPFILSGYLIQKFMIFSKNLKKNMNLITKIGGSLLLVTGLLVITNQLQVLGFYILEYLPFLQRFGYFFFGLVKTIKITPIIIIAPPMNNSSVGFSPKRKIAANNPVSGIPIVTIGRTLYIGLFFIT